MSKHAPAPPPKEKRNKKSESWFKKLSLKLAALGVPGFRWVLEQGRSEIDEVKRRVLEKGRTEIDEVKRKAEEAALRASQSMKDTTQRTEPRR